MNIPIAGVATLFVALFLNIKSPKTTWEEKAEQMDYAFVPLPLLNSNVAYLEYLHPRNVLFVAAATATTLGLTWGGTTYSWSSYKVLVPLILGLIGIGMFIWIEKRFVKHPTVPFDILSHRTSLVGIFTTFLHGIVSLAASQWDYFGAFGFSLTVYFTSLLPSHIFPIRSRGLSSQVRHRPLHSLIVRHPELYP